LALSMAEQDQLDHRHLPLERARLSGLWWREDISGPPPWAARRFSRTAFWRSGERDAPRIYETSSAYDVL